MEKITALFMSLILTLNLCACTAAQPEDSEEEPSQGPTWQEQYDLGVRYLSEGNYQEAIIAFTAAIEIDPMQAETYEKLAYAYLSVGDTDSALQALRDGLTVTGDVLLQVRIDELAATKPAPTPTPEPAPEPTMELDDDISSQSWQAIYKDLIYELTSNPHFEGPSSPYSEEYGLYDLDGNGIPELFYGCWQGFDVYTCSNNNVVELGHIGYDYSLCLIPEKNAVWSGGGSCFAAVGCIYVLESIYQNGKLTPDYWEVNEYFPEFDQHEYDPNHYGSSIVYMIDYGDSNSESNIKKYFRRGQPATENDYIENPPAGSQNLELYTVPHAQYRIEDDLFLYVTPRIVSN